MPISPHNSFPPAVALSLSLEHGLTSPTPSWSITVRAFHWHPVDCHFATARSTLHSGARVRASSGPNQGDTDSHVVAFCQPTLSLVSSHRRLGPSSNVADILAKRRPAAGLSEILIVMLNTRRCSLKQSGIQSGIHLSDLLLSSASWAVSISATIQPSK